MNNLTYERYLDAVLGGWIGKSIGGTVGARFENNKTWIEVAPEDMFPSEVPPNDDLDLQVLWLKVLEEKGPALTSDDLAAAWLELCWYPFNEYGIFRRNWQLGIHPPYSGKFGNQFWETGMGCPIRAEIWGYVLPGAPELAAHYAELDGRLDHTAAAIGAEKMFAAMAASAFFVPDVRRLAEMSLHHLPAGSLLERLVRLAFACHDNDVPLRKARDRIMLAGGRPEGTDVNNNIPFTFLGLLYGGNDLEKTLHLTLNCGYDTDCTMATAAALLGQIMGAKKIPEHLKKPIGDTLVMGIQYRREEMTISALARDTARVGVLMSRALQTPEISDAPKLAPFPATAVAPVTWLSVDYEGMPSAAPGDCVPVTIRIEGKLPVGARLEIQAKNPGWVIVPSVINCREGIRDYAVHLHAPGGDQAGGNPWPQKHLFVATLTGSSGEAARYSFGVSGAALYQFLGAFYDPVPAPGQFEKLALLQQCHHFVSLNHEYLPEPVQKPGALWDSTREWLGREPLLVSHENEIDPRQLIGLEGAYCVYFSRTIISPEDREVFFIIGNSDSFRIELNGERILEHDEILTWSPANNLLMTRLKKGANLLVIKLLKRTDTVRFTIGIRGAHGGLFHCNDWMIDLADVVPGQA